jgi:hypothetical protein
MLEPVLPAGLIKVGDNLPGPTMVNAAFHNAARNPSNLPSDPVVTYSANAPYPFLYQRDLALDVDRV